MTLKERDMTCSRVRVGRGLAALILTLSGLGLTSVIVTDRAAASSSLGGELGPDRQLGPGDWLQNGGYRLVMQTDGNLVLYGPTGPLWATYTNSPSAQNAVLANQGDGNLVIYAPDRRVVWASRTNGKGAGRLVLQSDGNVVLYNTSTGQATWTTYTNGGVSKMKATGAVAFARAQIGKWYQWGATGPNTYDCSGLTMKAYASVGVTLNRTSYDQWKQGWAVSRAELQPGDLVFYNSRSHVAIYVGNNEVLQALKSGTQINYYSISYAGSIDGYRRMA
jgi:cell wall-associated NlpC family hydrolase